MEKNGLRFIIFILALCVFVGVFAACKQSEILKEMSEVSCSDEVLTWAPVEGADYYLVKIMFDEYNGYEKAVETNSYAIAVYKEGSYKFSVRAHTAEGFTAYSNVVEYTLSKDIDTSKDDSGKIIYKGTGTIDDPILISNVDELLSIKNGTRTEMDGEISVTRHLYYRQTKDIDLEGREVVPFATGSERFSGHYDGDGHKIVNFKQSKSYGNSAYTHIGLFGSMQDAEIINLTIDGYLVEISYFGNDFRLGAVAGFSDGSVIKNVHVVNSSIKINAPSATNYIGYVGMLIGESRGNRLELCSADGVIDARFARIYAGGLVGITKYSQGDILLDCASTVNVSTYGAGRNNNGIIAKANSGGLVGYGANISNLTARCYYSGTLSANVVDGGNPNNIGIGVFGAGNVQSSTGRSYLEFKDVYFNYEKLGYSINDEYTSEAAIAGRYAIGESTTSQNSRTTVYAFDNEQEKLEATFAAFDFENVWVMSENGPRLRETKVEFASDVESVDIE